MITEALISSIIDKLYDYAVKTLKETSLKLKTPKADLEGALNMHLQSVKNWSNEVIFSDLKKAKVTSDIYVDLDLYIYPRKIRISLDEKINQLPLKKVVENEEGHILLLGQPGSGKTTSMKYLCNQLFYNESFLEQYHFPIVIRLREFNKIHNNEDFKSGLIIESLFNIFGLRVDWSGIDSQSQTQIDTIKERIVFKLLDSLNAVLILDGFDEMSFTNRREIVVKEIEMLSSYLEKTKMIVTSRTTDFNYSIEKLAPYEICSLNESQILTFANKWLNSQKDAENFVSEVLDSPFADTTMRPLTIAHLCAIYERIGKIPDKPKTIYKKVVNLLLEEWDEQRDIKRESKYANFEIDRKFEFLCCLAYQLTTSLYTTFFSKKQLESIYQKIYFDFDLLRNESKSVVSELESHTGLFIQSGYEHYEFAHKSLQEYLTAEYIVKLPNMTDVRSIYKVPNEMAIATTISSSPSLYFIELVNRIPENNIDFEFIEIYINRLLLEKPDFNQNEEVILSALRIYSLYISHNFKGNQLKLFISDDLVYEFENFMIRIFQRNSITLLEKYYLEASDFISDTGFNILLFQANKKNKKYPQKLYCRESFVKNIMAHGKK